MPRKVHAAVRRYMTEIGRKGGRSKTLSAAERQANARRAALARWRRFEKNLQTTGPGSRSGPIWEVARELVAMIPESERRKLPRDGASQLDHYLYAAPKRDR